MPFCLGATGSFQCSAEINSACAKVFALVENTCTAHKRRPTAWGPTSPWHLYCLDDTEKVVKSLISRPFSTNKRYFGPAFVTYLSSTMIFLHFSQRYAVILSPFNLATRPPSAFRRWRCAPLCHNNAARLHTLPCIISAPQNGQFITIPLPSKFIWISFSIAYCYIICHRRQGHHTHCCSISEMLWHL